MRLSNATRVGTVFLIAAITSTALFVLFAATSLGGESTDGYGVLYLATAVFASVATATRALRRGSSQPAWALLSLCLSISLVGAAIAAVIAVPGEPLPVPSLADPFWLLVPTLGGLGFAILVRRDPHAARRGTWMEALLALATIAALSAALVLEPITEILHTLDVAGGLTVVAYPLLDVAMIGTAFALLIRRGWRLSPASATLLGSLVVLAVCDSVFFALNVGGGYESGPVLMTGWMVAALGVALAAQLDDRPRETSLSRVLDQTLPVLLTAVSLFLLVQEALDDATPLTIMIAAAALAASLGRMAAMIADNRAMLATTRVEALTDPLTGLGNRRQLLNDLEAWDGTPVAVAMFDLDGFKTYNDTFGHAAGDALLRRIADALRAATAEGGRVYRMGGDEFSALLPLETDVDQLVANLTQVGDGFRVGASHGTVHMPADASNADEALRLADARMYARKFRSRGSAARQTTDALLAALQERNADLARHGAGVESLADEVAEELGVSTEDRDHIRAAARLHDLGKLAIPEHILNKPAALDPDEWAFMRQHTIVGERILRAAPSLTRAAAVVRSSHERWDGGGYPDGLRERQIPIGARIVFACDALDAMTENRVYRRGMSLDDALAELEANAGTQFDPTVVTALIAAVRRRQAEASSTACAADSPELIAPSM